MPRTATPPKASRDTAGVLAALVQLSEGEFSAGTIRSILGDLSVSSLPEVAKAFGVAPTTVRQLWRPDGMPGKPGHYKLGDVLLWYLERQAANAKKNQPTAKSERLAEIELERAELDLRERRAKAEEREGETASIWHVRADLRALLCVVRQTLLGIPRNLTPLLPEAIADTVRQQLESDVRKALVYLSDAKVYNEKVREAYEAVEQVIQQNTPASGRNGKPKSNKG